MFRIVKEENKLTGKGQYIIERRTKFLWIKSWTIYLGLDVYQNGPIVFQTLDAAKQKMQEIISSKGLMIRREVCP